MARWTKEEEKKLLEMHQTGYSYKEIAEVLSKSEASVNCKLQRMRKDRNDSKTIEPIYRGEADAATESVPETQQVYDTLILALLNEFHKIRKTLHNLGRQNIKHKAGLYNNLCRTAETLISLLKIKPEKNNIQEWFDKIAIKNLPKEAHREPRRVIQRWMKNLRKSSRTRRSFVP